MHRSSTCSSGNSVGVIHWLCSNPSELPPPPANISTCNISDSSAIITWSVAEGHSVSRAVIRYQQTEQTDYSQQVELGVQPDQTSMRFQLRGLRADSTYQLELWTVNNMGESAERPQISLQTLTPQESSRESVNLHPVHLKKPPLLEQESGIQEKLCIYP